MKFILFFCFSKLLYHSITMKPCPFHNMPRLEIIYVRYCYIRALVITFKHNGGSFWKARWCGLGLIWRDGCASDQDRVISLVEVVVNLDSYGIRTIAGPYNFQTLCGDRKYKDYVYGNC